MSLTSSPSQAIRIVAVGLLFGFVGLLLTYQRQIGLGFALFGLLFLGGLLIFARRQQVAPIRRNLVLLVPTAFFTIMLAIRSSTDMTTMNFGAAGISVLLLAFYFRRDNLLRQDMFEVVFKGIMSSLGVCFEPITQFVLSAKWLKSHVKGGGSLGPVARGAAITIPVVGMFVLLLSSADEVFSRLVSRLFSVFDFANVGTFTIQTVYIGVITWGAVGLLAVVLLERKVKRAPQPSNADAEAPEAAPLPAPIFSLGYTESLMVLGSTCAVFATFVVIQFVYLFGGARNITNFSYADYVHRGFAELVIVAVLTLGLELLLNSVTIRRTRSQATIVRGLSTVLILLTGVILASAFQRMRLYDSTYGLTTLRLTIYVFIVWLGLSFVGFALSLYWTPRTLNVFGVTALVVVFGFAATLDLLNPDYFVAWQNISRGDVDPLQLSALSSEAAPALVTLVDSPEPGLRSIVRYTLSSYIQDQDSDDWRDFNVDRRQITAALQSVQDRLDRGGVYSNPSSVHSFSDFSQLRQGMTVREITRQFGFPSSSYSRFADLSGAYSPENNTLSVSYALNNGTYINLRFDSAKGLYAACQQANFYGECATTLPLAP